MRKGLIIILSILFALCLALGIIGFIKNSSNTSSNDNKLDNKHNKNSKIVYEYYLEDTKVDEMPVNNEDNQYVFSKYLCTNNLSGMFDEEKWEFISNNNVKDSVCKLYFNKSKYDVTILTTNATVDESNIMTIDRGTDGEFKIIPNEGYDFSEIICANEKEAIYNSITNTILISNITSDISCKATFEKKNFNVNLNISNGKIKATSDTGYFGDKVTIIVEPNEGYSNPSISCTNEQTAIYDSNQIIIEKITNNTDCNVDFNKTVANKYDFVITNPTEFADVITITEGNSNFKVLENSEVNIKLSSNDPNIVPNLKCNQIPTTQTLGNGEIIFNFLGINKNITCSIEKK